MAKPNPYLEYLFEQLAPLGRITSRAMFGGHCLYADGVVFALVAGAELYLKVDEVSRPQFEARGLAAFRPFPDQDLVMSYYPAPPELFESAEGLREWGGAAVAAGVRAQTRKKPKKKATSATSRRPGR